MPSPDDARLYERILAEITAGIGAGRYPAGSLLPSVREIVTQHQVSTSTARKVLRELVAAGCATVVSTRGHISTGQPPQRHADRILPWVTGTGQLQVQQGDLVLYEGELVTVEDVRYRPVDNIRVRVELSGRGSAVYRSPDELVAVRRPI